MHFRPRAHLCALLLAAAVCGATASNAQSSDADRNKALARRFYEEVWFKPNLAFVDEVFAPHYVVHDIGDRKGVREEAAEQKEIAGFFWKNGRMSGRIDFQVAEGDYVATRWTWSFQPTTLGMRLMGGDVTIPIVNIMRFENGKVVEIWNHRHDIDAIGPARMKMAFVFGLLAGIAIWSLTALVRRLRRARSTSAPSS
jgi:hypothetical protein